MPQQESEAYQKSLRKLLSEELSQGVGDMKEMQRLLVAMRRVPVGLLLVIQIEQRLRSTFTEFAKHDASKQGPDSTFAELLY